MKPETVTLALFGVFFLGLALAFNSPESGAPVPVLTAEGSPVLGPDGQPKYHHPIKLSGYLPSAAFLLCSLTCFGWLFLRVVRTLYRRVFHTPRKRTVGLS